MERFGGGIGIVLMGQIYLIGIDVANGCISLITKNLQWICARRQSKKMSAMSANVQI